MEKKFEQIRKRLSRIKNSLGENGQSVVDVLYDTLDAIEAEARTRDIDDKELAEKLKAAVDEAIKTLTETQREETREYIDNAIKNKMQAFVPQIKNRLDWGTMSRELKTSLAKVYLTPREKNATAAVVNSVKETLVKNDISGLTFGEVTDFKIVDGWGDDNRLFSKFTKSFATRFFYTEQEIATAEILAKQWDKTSDTIKLIQDINAVPKTIDTKYIYKRQRIAQEDLDEIIRLGKDAEFLQMVDEELGRVHTDSIVLHILVGDTFNPAGSRITSFESIGAKTTSDIFTTIVAEAGTPNIVSIRNVCDAVKNPYDREKVLVINPQLFSQVARYTLANDATMFHSRDEFAAQVGVNEIIFSDLLGTTTGNLAVCMLPSEYHVVEKNAVDVSYMQWDTNSLFLQKEKNIGGGIHGLYSTAVLKK